MDGHGREQAGDRLVADQERDHRQHDGAGEASQVAQLAGAEGEAGIVRVFTGVAVGKRRQQQRAGMGAHVQPICDQRDGAERETAHDLQNHHGRAQRDDPPCPALGPLVPLAEEDVTMYQGRVRECVRSGDAVHISLLFQVGADNIEQLFGRFRVQRAGMLFGVHQMRADMILDDLGHKSGQCAAHTGDQMHHLLATALAFQRALNCLDLALHTAHARQQLLLLTDGMGHAPKMT